MNTHENRSLRNERTPVTIVVPCYQEAPVIPHLADRLQKLSEKLRPSYQVEFIFVDDGSRDETPELLKRTFREEHQRIVRHAQNRGIGAAILTGIELARTEIVCCIDADCTYDPLQITDLLAQLRPDIDLITASPYHIEGQVRNIPIWRLFLSRSLSRLYAQTLQHQLATYTSCFRVYRRSAVASLALRDEGFTGVAEILAHVDLRGGRIVEVPAVLSSRQYGESKMKVLRAVRGHVKLLTRLWLLKLTGTKFDR
jgi:dolichol-phosphate mannosyltransferase